MAYVSLFLPTSAGDFSAACSVFFDLDGVCIVLDPKGCTMDYVQIEDPRLPEGFGRVRSARLTDVDITLGDCQNVSSIAKELIGRYNPSFIALIGSTVSSIIGMDVQLIADELEEELGIPAIAVDTDGFTSYAQGIHTATKAVIQRFGEEGPKGNVFNILGATPLDFWPQHLPLLMAQTMEKLGYTHGSTLSMPMGIDDVRKAPQASLNLVVSSAGQETARWMKREYEIPFITHCPVCENDEALRRLLAGESLPASPAEGPRVLIMADAVIGVSIRDWMLCEEIPAQVDVASFFKTASPLKGVTYLQGDLKLMEMLERADYDWIVGDPLLARLPAVDASKLIELPQPAISGLLFQESFPLFAEGDPLLEQLRQIGR